MNILMVGNNPEGDKWTYDDETEKSIPSLKLLQLLHIQKKVKNFVKKG